VADPAGHKHCGKTGRRNRKAEELFSFRHVFIGFISMKRRLSSDHLEKKIQRLEKETDKCRRIEAQLKECEARFRDIAENALEWIWEVDSTGKYTYSSPVVKQILGYRPNEVVEKFLYDFFHPDEKSQLKKAAFKTFSLKKPFDKFINRNLSKDGKTVVLLTSGIPVMDMKRTLIGYRGVVWFLFINLLLSMNELQLVLSLV
jgi:PAS domain S-box-containing protein